MDVVDQITQVVNESLEYVNSNKILSAVLGLFLVLYAALAAPKLPKSVTIWFDNMWFKLGFMFLIAYMATKDSSVAIIAAVALLVTLQTLSAQKTAETVVKAVEAKVDAKVDAKVEALKERFTQEAVQKEAMVEAQVEAIREASQEAVRQAKEEVTLKLGGSPSNAGVYQGNFLQERQPTTENSETESDVSPKVMVKAFTESEQANSESETNACYNNNDLTGFDGRELAGSNF